MTRRILAVAVALALAVVGCVAVVAYVRSADDRALAGREAAWVIVAVKRIPAGTTAAEVRAGKYTERVAVPAMTVPKDTLSELDGALDALVLTADVPNRQLLLRGMFDEPTRLSGGLALPAGRLAVSVEMTAAGRVANYVQPGSKVAVFDTFTMQEGKGRVPAGDRLNFQHQYNHATRVLLPRVEVIAVGERGTAGATLGAPAAAGEATAPPTKSGAVMLITVAVTQAEAEKLVHATQTGTLYLALLDDTARIEPGPGLDNYTLLR